MNLHIIYFWNIKPQTFTGLSKKQGIEGKDTLGRCRKDNVRKGKIQKENLEAEPGCRVI